MFCPTVNLNEEQKGVFSALPIMVCAINGHMSDEAQTTLVIILSELLEKRNISKKSIYEFSIELSNEEILKNSELKSEIMGMGEAFEDERTKRILLLVILITALSNGEINNNQKKFINLVATSLDIEIEIVAELAKKAASYVEKNKIVATMYANLNKKSELILQSEDKGEEFGW